MNYAETVKEKVDAELERQGMKHARIRRSRQGREKDRSALTAVFIRSAALPLEARQAEQHHAKTA